MHIDEKKREKTRLGWFEPMLSRHIVEKGKVKKGIGCWTHAFVISCMY